MCSSVRRQRTIWLPVDGFSWNVMSIFRNFVQKIKVLFKSDKNTGTVHKDLHTFITISRSVLLRMRNASDKILETIKTHIICSIMFFRKCGKVLYSRIGQRWHNGTCALHAGYLRLQRDTPSLTVINIAFPQQQCLHECVSMLHYTCVRCLTCVIFMLLCDTLKA